MGFLKASELGTNQQPLRLSQLTNGGRLWWTRLQIVWLFVQDLGAQCCPKPVNRFPEMGSLRVTTITTIGIEMLLQGFLATMTGV